MRRFYIPVFRYLVKPMVEIYLRKPRRYRYQNLDLVIHPGVFHPGFFFSTKILLNYLNKFDLRGKRFLEIGAGSGLISLKAARNGAQVTACEISETAVKNIRENARRNALSLHVIHSDLFKNIPAQRFDWIVINPPYFPKNPVREREFAWYCGENLAFFQRFFAQLGNYVSKETQVCMILSEDCDVSGICAIAKVAGFQMKITSKTRVWGEQNWIFAIKTQSFFKNSGEAL